MEVRKTTELRQTLPPFASAPFTIELTVNRQEALAWFRQNWTDTFAYVIAYLIFLSVLGIWMEGRKRFELKNTFILWNLGLALFSLFGTIRTVPELVRILSEQDGFHNSVCELRTTHSSVVYFWINWFLLSKVVELGDTIFIVLRKSPLTFLHVYHHCSVLCVSWYLVAQETPTGRWFVTMNLFVHSLMYTYYALQLTRWFKIPRPFAMFITILQISQMVAGVAVNVHAYNVKRRGEVCDHSDGAMSASSALYFSYSILFINFFVRAYIHKGRKEKH